MQSYGTVDILVEEEREGREGQVEEKRERDE